jgi:hypothetical protein
VVVEQIIRLVKSQIDDPAQLIPSHQLNRFTASFTRPLLLK